MMCITKKTPLYFVLGLTIGLLAGCSQDAGPAVSGNTAVSDNSVSLDTAGGNMTNENDDAASNGQTSESETNAADSASGINSEKPEAIEYTISGNQVIRFTSYDLTDTYDENTATRIQMEGVEVTITGAGADVEDNKIVITREGTYVLEGNLTNGQIYVHTEDQEKVQLVLNNVDIFCNTSAPIYIANADKTVITLPEGTVNTVKDSLAPLDDSANGCIYSRDDLTFNGSGTLNVIGNYNNAISCKNDLKIINGIYHLTAANNALKGNDSIAILDCTMDMESLDDGCKVSNETETEKGYLFIAGGIYNITANDDCFQSTRAFIVRDGHVTARCYGKIVNCNGYMDCMDGWVTESQ